MTGPNAYYLYCSAYNDCSSRELPRFNGKTGFVSHAGNISNGALYPGESIEDFIDMYSSKRTE